VFYIRVYNIELPLLQRNLKTENEFKCTKIRIRTVQAEKVWKLIIWCCY